MENNKTGNVLLEDGFYLFTTPSCPTCEKLKNILNNIETPSNLSEIDAYENQQIAMELNMMGTPCIIDFRDGREYDRIYGAPSVKRIEAFFKGE